MNSEDLVNAYLITLVSGAANDKVLRNLLADDFTFSGPTRDINSPDLYIKTLIDRQTLGYITEIKSILANENEVAVLYEMVDPFTNSHTGLTLEWFTIKEEKITSIRVASDEKPKQDVFAEIGVY